MLKKAKQKNKINEVLKTNLFEVNDWHIYFLLIVLLMGIVYYISYFLNLKIPDIISVVGIMSTLFFSIATLRLSSKLVSNQTKKDISDNFSIPIVKAAGFVYYNKEHTGIVINLEDENKKLMFKYRISDIEISINKKIVFSRDNLENNEWQIFAKMSNKGYDDVTVKKNFGFDTGYVAMYEIKGKDTVDFQKQLKKLKETQKVEILFNIEVENIYNIITETKTQSAFVCSAFSKEAIRLTSVSNYSMNYELSFNK